MSDFYAKLRLPGETVDALNRLLARREPPAKRPASDEIDGPYTVSFDNGFTGCFKFVYSSESNLPVINISLYDQRGSAVVEQRDLEGPLNRPIEVRYGHDAFTMELIREARTELTLSICDTYVANGGGQCPFCGAGVDTFMYSRMQQDGDATLIREVTCCGCDGAWTEEYSLTHVREDPETWSPPSIGSTA